MEIKQKYPIDFAKGITWLIIIGLIPVIILINNTIIEKDEKFKT